MKILGLAVLLATVSCSAPSEPLPNTNASLTGVWSVIGVDGLLEVRFILTQDGTTDPVVSGIWWGYIAGCTPLLSSDCLRQGDISSEESSRDGAQVVLRLMPATECGYVSATVTATMTSANRIAGTYSPHPCPEQDLRTTSITLTRK